MFSASKLLVDGQIDRRTFLKRLSQAGVSMAGASALANSLGAADAPSAMTASAGAPETARVVTNLTGGELMAEFLIDWKVPYVFGLAGSEEVGFLDALVDRLELQYCTCLHENAAMAMADGYSRSTGQTSLVNLHSIAGAAYALGQLVGSYRDRIPVVVTVGRQSVGYRGQDGFLEAANLHELPRDYAQWIWDVMSPETIPEVLRRAFLLAEAPPGGPAFVTFSKDLWEMRVPRAEILPRSRSRVTAEVVPPAGHVEQIADKLQTSKLPVLFLGNEAIRYEVSAEVAGIAEAVGALVMTASKIPVVFPTTHPNYAGQFLDDRAIAGDIDVFWSLGGPMFKLGAKPKQPLISRTATIMHTSLANADVGRNYPVDVAAIASIKATSAAVLKALEQRDLRNSAIDERQRWVRDYTAKRRQALDDKARQEWNARPIATSRLMIELNRRMDSAAYIVTEIVTSDTHVRRYIDFDHTQPLEKRRRNFDTTSGVLGWGLAAAIGVKIGNPDREVWCLTADGCLNFGVQALWSAVRYEVPIGIVVFNNGQYQANRANQNRYNGRMVATGKYIGVNLGDPDINYIALASAYGIEGERVEEPDQFGAALIRCQRAMRAGHPYLVDVVIERRFKGAESTWLDKFSIARNQPRVS